MALFSTDYPCCWSSARACTNHVWSGQGAQAWLGQKASSSICRPSTHEMFVDGIMSKTADQVVVIEFWDQQEGILG